MKRKRHDIPDETVEEFFVLEGMSRNLAKTLIRISKCGYEKIPKNIYDLDEEDYNEDEYNVFIYDTLKYPPKSNPHKTLN